jgi:hypothetical protein
MSEGELAVAVHGGPNCSRIYRYVAQGCNPRGPRMAALKIAPTCNAIRRAESVNCVTRHVGQLRGERLHCRSRGLILPR